MIMFDKFENRLELKGTLTTVTALRISQGRSSEPIGSDLPVVKDILGKPLIPGSSFKGAMRSRLESFLRGINEDLAIEPSELTSATWMNRLKELKEKYKGNDAQLTREIWEITDLASRLFGSPWTSGKFQVRDLTVRSESWFGQYQERDGVAIDRDTETAAEGKLYDFQVVPAAVQFDFQAVVENATEVELGLLMVGLHQFETEQIPLGGGRSRGLGVVKLELNQMNWFDAEDSPDRLLAYLKRLVNQESSESAYADATSMRADWSEALFNHLTNTFSSKTPSETTN